MSDTALPSPHGPLSGIRVVDLTINVLGPMATQLLGDMGADVFKIEPPGGDPMRSFGPRRKANMASHFLNLNRNKRSVILDLKQSADSDALLRLVDSADVFVHNMRTMAAERLGIGPEAIQKRNPNIIYAYATGYRADGPKRDRPAFDDIIQGESGLSGLIARASGEPGYVPYAIADKLCGVYLSSAINAALLARERGAGGQVVHVPMFETMVSFNLADHMWEATYSDDPEDAGYPRMFSPDRRPLMASDSYICIMAVTTDQWNRLFAAVDRDDLIGDPRFADMDGRSANVDELYAILRVAIGKRTLREWTERLDEADIPNAPMNTLADLISHEYLRENDFFRRYTHPDGGEYTTLGFPISFSRTPGGLSRHPPSLGEHTAATLGAERTGEDDFARLNRS